MLCEARVKIFKKLLISSTAMFLAVPALPGLADSFEKQSSNKGFLVSQNTESDSDTLKITVTGTRNPRPINEVPSSITKYDYEETFQGNSIDNLRDLFQYEPSITLSDFIRNTSWSSYKGPRTSSENINIRGLDGNRVLMQVDGISIPRYEYGESFNVGRGDYIDYCSIKDVEVVKGPSSSLYGSDSIAGTVSFNSLQPSDLLKDGKESALEFPASFDGINNSTRACIRAATDFGQGTKGLIAISDGKSGNFNLKTSSEYIDDIDANTRSYYGVLAHELNDTSDISLTLESVNKDTSYTTASGNLNTTVSSMYAQSEISEAERDRISLNYKNDLKNNNNLIDQIKINTYYQDTGFDNKSTYSQYSQYASSTRSNDLEMNTYGIGIQLRSDVLIGNNDHVFTYGIDHSSMDGSRMSDVINNVTGAHSTNYPRKSSPDTTVKKSAIYIQDEIFMDKLKLVASLRYDNYDLDAENDSYYDYHSNVQKAIDLNEGSLNPKLGALYPVNDNVSVYGQYAKGFKAPTWSELNSSHANTTYYLLPNPDLKPETSNSYELGIRGNYSKYDFDIAAFYSNYNDFIKQFQSTGKDSQNRTVYKSLNAGEVNIHGLESRYNYFFNEDRKGFNLSNSIALTYGREEAGDIPLDSVNPLTIVNGIGYKTLDEKLSVDLLHTFQGKAKVKDDYQDTDAYGNNRYLPEEWNRFDIEAKYKASSNLSLTAGIHNILDTKYYLHSDLRHALFTSGDTDKQRFSRPGRSLKAGFNYKF